MKRLNITFGTILVMLGCVALSPTAQTQPPSPAPTIVTFDVPGAGTGPFQGTFVVAITPSGEAVGYYIDGSYGAHSFVRAKNGTFTTFDVPGSVATLALSINPERAVTGVYEDSRTFAARGFVRDANGTFTIFDAPLAGGGDGTQAANINPGGTIAGWFSDANQVRHGFVRAANGSFSTFDVPGAGTGHEQGTANNGSTCLNAAGTLAGYYIDSNNAFHGYVRTSAGNITSFDSPNAGTGPFQGTFTASINAAGTIAGFYTDSNYVSYGLVRAANGSMRTFNVTGAGNGPGQGTFVEMISDTGAMTGFYTDASNVNHGFAVSPNGTFMTFDVPGASTSDFTGTIPSGMDAAGDIAGFYFDDNDALHGFLLTK